MNADEREELLARLLAGESSEDDPQVRAAMAEDPTMREELQILRGLEADYRRLATQQRDDLTAASALAAGPGEDRVAAALRAFVAEQPVATPRTSAWTRRSWWLAAAGTALAVGIGWWATRPPGEALPVTLGRSPDGLSPSGAVAEFTEFGWTTPAAPGRTFTLEIVDAGSGREVVTRELSVSPWQPTAAERAALPDDIQWSLRVRDADDTEITLTTRATRRR
ncbi:MAG: hypothetical protein IPK26_21070 [Planctomycetes bacterium]|nr:hypothetical protein [Planctomycetota bacterium]